MKDKMCGAILGLIILLVAIAFVFAYKERIQKINEGSFTLVSDSECDK